MKTTKILAVFGVIAAIASITLLLWRIDWPGFTEALKQAEWAWLIPVTFCNILAVAFRSLRLSVLMGPRIGFWPVFHIQNIGSLINNLVPMRVGEVAMLFLFGRETGIGKLRGLSVIVIDRLLDLLLAVLIFLLIALASRHLELGRFSSLIAIAAIAILGFACLFLAYNQRRRLRRTLLCFGPFRRRRGRLLVRRIDRLIAGADALGQPRGAAIAILSTSLFWLAIALAGYCSIRSTSPDASLLASSFAIASTMIGIAVTSAPGGIGITHAAFIFALGFFDIPETNALVAGIVFHGIGMLTYGLLGIISLRHFGLQFRKMLKPQD